MFFLWHLPTKRAWQGGAGTLLFPMFRILCGRLVVGRESVFVQAGRFQNFRSGVVELSGVPIVVTVEVAENFFRGSIVGNAFRDDIGFVPPLRFADFPPARGTLEETFGCHGSGTLLLSFWHFVGSLVFTRAYRFSFFTGVFLAVLSGDGFGEIQLTNIGQLTTYLADA